MSADSINRHAKNPSATIANGATDSSAINMDAYAFGGFIIPSAFTGATVSFKVSTDGTNYYALYDQNNTLISITVGTSRAYPFPDEIGPWLYAKIVSASAEGAARTIALSLKG